MTTRLLWLILLCACMPGLAQEVPPSTKPPTLQGEFSTQPVAGMDSNLTRKAEQSIGERQKYWQRDFASVEAYDKSVQPNRERLRTIIGAVDARLPVTALEFVSSTTSPAKVGETEALPWRRCAGRCLKACMPRACGSSPKASPLACVVAIPDADQTPEMLVGLAPGLAPERQFARRLAENGCEVLVPVLIDRQDTWSGNARSKRFTNQSASRMDIPPGLPSWAGTSSDMKCRRCRRQWTSLRAEGRRRKAENRRSGWLGMARED